MVQGPFKPIYMGADIEIFPNMWVYELWLQIIQLSFSEAGVQEPPPPLRLWMPFAWGRGFSFSQMPSSFAAVFLWNLLSSDFNCIPALVCSWTRKQLPWATPQAPPPPQRGDTVLLTYGPCPARALDPAARAQDSPYSLKGCFSFAK